MAKDNGSFEWKRKIRQRLRMEMPTARVLEFFAGEGGMYRACWEGLDGATMDKDKGKIRDAAIERPRWPVYAGDTEKAIRAGWMAGRAFDIIDIDAYGSPWPFLAAWFEGKRRRAPATVILLTDGYMRQASIAPPCRALFHSRAEKRPAERGMHSTTHKLVQAAITAGSIDANEPCEICRVAQSTKPDGKPMVIRHHFDYDRPLDTIPLCLGCHRKVHGGKLPEPRTGRTYEAAAPRMDVPPEMYLETANQRIREWTAQAGGAVVSFTTIPAKRMRLHTLRLTFP